ncbi:MAG: hypothetical protein ABIE74_00420 [Pseudomonadota bacterium]
MRKVVLVLATLSLFSFGCIERLASVTLYIGGAVSPDSESTEITINSDRSIQITEVENEDFNVKSKTVWKGTVSPAEMDALEVLINAADPVTLPDNIDTGCVGVSPSSLRLATESGKEKTITFAMCDIANIELSEVEDLVDYMIDLSEGYENDEIVAERSGLFQLGNLEVNFGDPLAEGFSEVVASVDDDGVMKVTDSLHNEAWSVTIANDELTKIDRLLDEALDYSLLGQIFCSANITQPTKVTFIAPNSSLVVFTLDDECMSDAPEEVDELVAKMKELVIKYRSGDHSVVASGETESASNNTENTTTELDNFTFVETTTSNHEKQEKSMTVSGDRSLHYSYVGPGDSPEAPQVNSDWSVLLNDSEFDKLTAMLLLILKSGNTGISDNSNCIEPIELNLSISLKGDSAVKISGTICDSKFDLAGDMQDLYEYTESLVEKHSADHN